MTRRLAALHSGAAYHCETLEGDRYAPLFAALIRPEDLDGRMLVGIDTLIVPCRTRPARLAPHVDVLLAFLRQGGTLVVMGETFPDEWLPGVVFHPVETDFSWWLEPGADLGVTIAAPAHRLMRGMTPADLTWHLHGHFEEPMDGEVLARDREGRSILQVETRLGGRLLLTSLDPTYHHGSGFMPTTTRFLDRFLPALGTW